MTRRALWAWAVLAAIWGAAALRSALRPWQAGGGIGAVSSGVTESIVDSTGILVLLAVSLALGRSGRRAGRLAKTLHTAHLLVTLGYMVLGAVWALLLSGSLTQDGARVLRYVEALTLIWAPFVPLQVFFLAAAVTIAVDRARSRERPRRTGGKRRALALALLAAQGVIAGYVSLILYLFAVWMVHESEVPAMAWWDWYLEGASRAAMAAAWGGLAFLVNARFVAPALSRRIATGASLVWAFAIAAPAVAGAAWFVIAQPRF